MVESAEQVITPESVQFLRAIDAVSEVIGFTPYVFRDTYNDVNTSDDSLARKAANLVLQCSDLLNVPDEEEYKLDSLLNYMMTNAPHRTGRRFVSVAIILANQHRRLVELARSWMEDFALALLTRSSEMHKSIRTIEVFSHVQTRDQNHCAITKHFNEDLIFSRPLGSLRPDEVNKLSVEYFIPIPPSSMSAQLEFAYNLLWAWSGLTEDDWDNKLQSEENALLLASPHIGDHRYMTAYFEQQGNIPNAYTARRIRGLHFFTGDSSREVVFKAKYIRPPSPRIVRAHCALVQLVDRSGALDALLARKRKLSEIKEGILL